jgi:hypothetical protein
MSLIILIGGRMTAGKDVVADYLVGAHGFRKLGMSDTLAEALYVLNPIIPSVSFPERDTMRYQEHVDSVGYVRAKEHPEVRRLLQVLGTEVGRKLLGENIWVEAAKKKILALVSEGHNVVITGIRFPNETELENQFYFLNDVVAVSVYVDRPSLPPLESTHSSEGSLSADDFQYVLTNDGTIPELTQAAEALLSTIADDYL